MEPWAAMCCRSSPGSPACGKSPVGRTCRLASAFVWTPSVRSFSLRRDIRILIVDTPIAVHAGRGAY